MSFPKFISLFLCLVLLSQPLAAFETDQFNLPPQPLADIGDEVGEYVAQNLSKAIERVNSKITKSALCLESKTRRAGCDSLEKEHAKLIYLRSEDAVAGAVYDLLGTGIPPVTHSGSWMESHRFEHQPARYKTSFSESIYASVPINYISLSSTVNLYGSHFGSDKIAHIFQQGYTYYRMYKKDLSGGTKAEDAAKRAIRWGRKTERTFYGTLVSGVYSNADLCANYTGMKFYLGLAREIRIGGETRPPAVILKEGKWEINSSAEKYLLKPFISDHLNEALNPSLYTKVFGIRNFVRKTVRKHSCGEWMTQFPNLSQSVLNQTTESLKTWHGEDYGHQDSENFITIADTCFDAAGKFIESPAISNKKN